MKCEKAAFSERRGKSGGARKNKFKRPLEEGEEKNGSKNPISK